ILTKLTQNFAAKNQHDEFTSFSPLDGKIWFAAPICVSQLEENKHAITMMKEIDAHYSGRDDIHFVLISIDGEDHGVGPAQLAEAAKKLGLPDTRWTLLTSSNTDRQRGLIKDKLRLGLVLKRDKGDPAGKWKFPSEIALLDHERHLRGRYDFKETHEVAAEYKEKVKEHPELLKDKNIDAYIKATELLRETLYKHTDYVLNEAKSAK
ncbi:MAG: hypothetical protein ACPGUY_10550, partial [Akkermansiaceae bacterium]